ncbi:protein transport protein sec31-like [Pollicipes pollicipes]|uniref:protein transport protein sec31-like n=1 Tax=Pollicipes pollicipes TaxID=41117 RepID=UPI001884D4BD|nr:protein transport protein sec31-like [Pollicipes pollicipes]
MQTMLSRGVGVGTQTGPAWPLCEVSGAVPPPAPTASAAPRRFHGHRLRGRADAGHPPRPMPTSRDGSPTAALRDPRTAAISVPADVGLASGASDFPMTSSSESGTSVRSGHFASLDAMAGAEPPVRPSQSSPAPGKGRDVGPGLVWGVWTARRRTASPEKEAAELSWCVAGIQPPTPASGPPSSSPPLQAKADVLRGWLTSTDPLRRPDDPSPPPGDVQARLDVLHQQLIPWSSSSAKKRSDQFGLRSARDACVTVDHGRSLLGRPASSPEDCCGDGGVASWPAGSTITDSDMDLDSDAEFG